MAQAPTVAVIVVAAGSGSRLRADAPKAFVTLDDRTILEHALRPLARLEPPVQVIVVVPSGWEPAALEALTSADLTDDACRVVPGGQTRHESVVAGLAAVSEGIDTVLIHDAARALAPTEIFEAVVAAVAESSHGVVPVLLVPDALKRVRDARVIESVSRDDLVAAQTPQGFPRRDLDVAYASAEHAEHHDDASVFLSAGFTVETVPGHDLAFKITFADQLERARALVTGHPASMRVGSASDTHAFGTVRGLRLAGLEWPDEFRLEGHSDGDAVAHAIVDALLVAAGLGDIGALVGTDDPALAGAAGDVVISRAIEKLAENGFRPVNVTAQIVGNRPRFSGRRAEAEAVLSAWVGAPVGLSATTTDGLGFTGEGQGIAVMATALVDRIS